MARRHRRDRAARPGRNTPRRRAAARARFPPRTAIARCWRSMRRRSPADTRAAIGVRRRVGQIGRDEERRDLGCHSEGRVSRLFFPSVLRTDGTVAREKDGRPAHHRPERIPSCRVDHAFARRKIDQQNRRVRFRPSERRASTACRRATCSATSDRPAPASPAGTAARA